MWKKLGDVLQAIGAVIAVMLTIVFSIMLSAIQVIAVMLTIVFSIMLSAIPIAIAILFVLWVFLWVLS